MCREDGLLLQMDARCGGVLGDVVDVERVVLEDGLWHPASCLGGPRRLVEVAVLLQ